MKERFRGERECLGEGQQGDRQASKSRGRIQYPEREPDEVPQWFMDPV